MGSRRLCTGKRRTLEQRERMSLAHKGHKVSPEQRTMIGNFHRGKVTSAETRAKISAAQAMFSEEEKKYICWLHDFGYSYSKIAKHMSCAKTTIAKIVRRGRITCEEVAHE